MKVEGVKGLKAAVEKHKQRLGKNVERGLKRAGLFVQRESQQIVPVDIGNLKASADTRHTGSGFDTEVRVVYTAAYAIYVHENLDNAHGEKYNQKHADDIAKRRHYWVHGKKRLYRRRGPNQQAKFLEHVIRTKRKRIIEIVVEQAKL